MNKIVYTLFIILMTFSSCQKEEAIDYELSRHMLYIPTTDDMNVSTFSFRQLLDENSYEIEFVVKLAGQVLTEDKTFEVEVVSEKTTAQPDDYTLQKEQFFHAGVFEDVVRVILHKTAHLDTDDANLTIRLVSNENFSIAEYIGDPLSNKLASESICAQITFNNKIFKPGWWDKRITNLFLGAYSDAKYSRFMESSNVTDLSGYSFTETREMALQFKIDIATYGWTEDDGSPMTVTVN